jgi:tetratricopeptide (TPR) repeat protein
MTRALVLALLVSSAARADGTSALWDDVIHPNRLRCTQLLQQARRGLELRTNSDDERNLARLKAHHDLVEATVLCPANVEAFSLLGQALIALGDVPSARKPLERARELEDAGKAECGPRPANSPAGCPRDPHLAFHLAFTRSLAGDLEGSVVEYRRAEQAGGLPSGEQWLLPYDLGDSLMALGRLDEAIESYRRAVHAAEHNPMPRYALAVALDRDEQLEKARAELLQALADDPHQEELNRPTYVFLPPADRHYYLALTARARGKFIEARQHVQAFLAGAPDSPYVRRGRQLLATLPP